MKRICVLGLGYIGLPTASMLATHGLRVCGVDVNPRVVEILNSGSIHIEEVGLQTVVRAAMNSGNLIVQARPEQADAFIIAVPTPIKGDKTADMCAVVSATEAIVPHLEPGNLVVLESTSPPRTTLNLVKPILERSGLVAGRDFSLAYSPERVLPGQILRELVENSRVIGGIDRASVEAARDLYATFVRGEMVLTDVTTAEMVKLMENTFRDVNIALANEFALIGECMEINIWEAIAIANRHPRVNIHRPGPGVGGHCIAVDPWFLVEVAPQAASLILKTRLVNDGMPHHVVAMVSEQLADLAQPVVACLGLTYKADVDDVRESPAIEVRNLLAAAGYQVRSYDPHVREAITPDQMTTLEETVQGADCLVVLTDHAEFRRIDPDTIAPLMRSKRVVDTRGCLPRAAWQTAGFTVRLLGNGQLAQGG